MKVRKWSDVFEVTFMVMVLMAFVILAALTIKVAAEKGASEIVMKDDVELCMEEIYPQYEWERYAYTAQEAIEVKEGKDARYYLIVAYAEENGSLHRYEWFCRVVNDDVDCELVRNDLCPEY